jgi:hypothetical protein
MHFATTARIQTQALSKKPSSSEKPREQTACSIKLFLENRIISLGIMELV